MGDVANELENMANRYDDKLHVRPDPLPGSVCQLYRLILEYYFVIYPFQVIRYHIYFYKEILKNQKSTFFLFEWLLISIYEGLDRSEDDVLLILNIYPLASMFNFL